MKKVITLLTIGILFGFSAIIFQQIQADETVRTNEVNYAQKQVIPTTLGSDNIEILQSKGTLTDEQIAAMMKQFMDTLVQEIDDHYRVIRFDTKEALIKEFESIATKEVVKPYVDYYFEEKDNKLFILPTETPAWFIEGKDYKRNVISDQKVEITQSNETALYGPYTINVTFEKMEGQWKITKISH
ncbi:hypothetical protein F9U64_13335 [Gracilibacillus oryzae]|uniref:DUF3993 domain-containing protein n=1 Tax=Gracilibacillus oryzae TaxID=1672701 RepID=A0A7C8GTD9_9BACI|nr:hypothetical protein [Gracilibacillus oryzae]KAB8131476.1 hypothetical protein F9U64_13335 [Gracilibacillus oryzae]